MAYIEQEIRHETGEDIKLWLIENDEQKARNEDALFPWFDPQHGPTPLVEAYTFQESVAVNFRCDALLLSCIDAIAECYDITRSEVLRRGLHDFIARLDGEFQETQLQLELPSWGEGAEPLRTAQAKRQKTPGHRPAAPVPDKQSPREAA